MLEETIEELKEAITKAEAALKREIAKLRTGRASPALLDSVKVDYYGAITPLSQMATVSVPEPRLLTVKPWDKGAMQLLDKAIRESNLGLNPQSDGDIIRVPVPPLSEERRRDLVKLAKKYGEECKVAIRKARHDAMNLLDQLKKDGDASEDDVERAKKKVEDVVKDGTHAVDTLTAAKEKEILQV